MAYGDYNGPDKPNKGHEGGACNRQRCQAEPANWYNHGSLAWYCDDCRRQIEFDPFNYRDWKANWEPNTGYPMFETREMMDKREAMKAPDNGMYIGVDWARGDDVSVELQRTPIEDDQPIWDRPGNCLRASNPRVVVCHCASCGGK